MIDFNKQLPIIPTVYETATLQDNLEHSGGINISWKSKTDDEIPMGSYIVYPAPKDGQTEKDALAAGSIRYILLEPYAPTRQGMVYYSYSPQFRHPQNMLDRIPFWIKSLDAEGKPINLRTTSFTGFPHVIAQKFVDFFAEYANETQDTFFAETVGLTYGADNLWHNSWTFDISMAYGSGNPSTIISVSFDGSSIKQAATSIADAIGCNVYWDWSTKTIRFIAGTTIGGEAYNCFHVLGGTTNMGRVTPRGSFSTVTQRLTLADPVEGEDTFIINNKEYKILSGSIISGAGNGMRLTKDLILDEIYPKMELYIKTARQRLCRLTDENGEFIVDHFEKDGAVVPFDTEDATPVYKLYAKWYVTFAVDKALTRDYHFDQSLLINDQPLGMLFQMDFEDTTHMSTLVGRQFELTYFPSSESLHDKTDDSETPFEVNAGEFYIAFTAEGDKLLPGTTSDGMYPKAGDKVTLVNIALTEERVVAQEELLKSAKEIITLMQTPAGEYSETVHFLSTEGLQPKGTIAPVQIGNPSPFDTTKHGPVVTNINLNIDTNIAEVTVGSWSRKTKTGGMADKIETVTISASSPTTGGTSFSDGIIGKGGGYSGSGSKSIEANTINQTILKPDTLFSAILGNIIDVVACHSDGKIKMATDIYTKVTAYYGQKNVTESCSVSYSSDLPTGVQMYQEKTSGGTSGKKMAKDTEVALDNGAWLRIHFNKGIVIGDKLEISFVCSHPAYNDRGMVMQINSLRPGENNIRIDLDNEMDAIAVDSQGKVRFDRTVVVHASIYDGSSVASKGVTKAGTLTPNGLKIGNCTPTISDVVNGVVTITWAFTAGMTIGSTAKAVSLVYKDKTYTAIFSLTVIDTDAILQLSPSRSSVSFTRQSDNTLYPPRVALGLSLIRFDGTSTTELTSCPSGYTVMWKYDDTPDSTSDGTGWTSGNITTVQNTTDNQSIGISLFYGSVLIDRENVPIIKDGKNGANTIRLDISNEMDMIPTTAALRIDVARTVETTVRLFDGTTEVDISATTISPTGSPASSIATFSQAADGKGKKLSWAFKAGQTMAEAYNITISYTYKNVAYTAVFTVSASKGEAVWQLKPSLSAIPFQRNADNTLTPTSRAVGLSLVKIDGGSTATYASVQTGLTVRYSTSSMPSSASAGSGWSSGNITVGNTADNLYIAMFNSSGVLLDRETIPVIKDGKRGTSVREVKPYYAKQSPESYNGNPPQDGWKESIAALGAIKEGWYVWTKNVISFTDNVESTTTYMVSKWGIDGDGIENIETKFYESATLLTQTQLEGIGESDWKEYNQLALKSGDYIYTRTKITYDKGGTPTISYQVNRLGQDGVGYVATEEYYVLGNSQTDVPTGHPYTGNKPYKIYTAAEWQQIKITGGWSESRPTYKGDDKKYLWNFEVSFDTDGNAMVTRPICIGNYAKGIVSIVELYAISAYAVAPQAGSYPSDVTAWTDEAHDCAPTDAKPYQWNKTVTSYSDGSQDVFYHVSAVKGTRGRGITNTNIYYKADTTTPSTPSGDPSKTDWVDNGNDLITDANANKHLYESTCTTYSDGTYSWTAPIDDGLIRDMAATSEEFALSDSSTTVPTEGWSTSVTPTAGKWLWSRTVLTFKNKKVKYVNTQCVGYCGTDGNGIASITKTYAISAHGTTANDKTPPSDVTSWSQGSPATTDEKPYLWAKEVTEFTDSTTNIIYYPVGKRGDRGIDAQDIEWVFIRTKTNVAPAILNDSTYKDSNGKEYTSDDHLPHVDGNDNIENNNGTYECTDDPKGVDSTWKYEWEIKRSKGAAVDGRRSWNYYHGKMTMHNNLAESAFIIDIDNDNDQFGTDSDSKVLVAQTRQTTVSLYDGSTPQTLTSLTATLTYEDGTTVPSSVATVVATPSTGIVAVTVKQNNTANTHEEIRANITAVCSKGTKTITFTLRKVMGGAPGLNPVIYQLAPTQKVFQFSRAKDNTLTPSSRSTQINVAKTEGNTTTILSSAQTGVTYSWGFDESSAAQATNKAVGTTIPISSTQADSHHQVWVELSTGDRENVPIIKDGKNGANSIRLALDNEHEDFLYDGTKLVAPSVGASSPIRLYDGGTDITASMPTPEIHTVSGTTKDANGAYISNKTLYVKALTAATCEVVVKCTYDGTTYYAKFTANKTNQDKYDIVCKPSSIAYNSTAYASTAATATIQTVSLSATGIGIGGTPLSPTLSTSTGAGKLCVFWAYVSSNGTVGSFSTSPVTSKAVTKQECENHAGIYFELRYYTSASDYRVCDYETVEIAKTKDGTRGDDGRGIASITRYFNISKNGTSSGEDYAPDDCYYWSWQSVQPAPTASYPYLWEQVYTVYTDTSSTIAYHCIGSMGPQGEQGEQGNAYTLKTSPTQLIFNPNTASWVGPYQITVERFNNGVSSSLGTLTYMKIYDYIGPTGPYPINNDTFSVGNDTTCIRFDVSWTVNGNVVASVSVPVARFGQNGQNGQAGTAGHVGRWYYYAGVYSSSSTYKMEETQAPYVQYGTENGKPKFWMLDFKGDGRASDTATEEPSDSSTEWTRMQSQHEYYMAKVFFGDSAYFGSFIINGDWMISQSGTQGSVTDFNSDGFKNYITNGTSYSGFIPNFAVDGLTGRTYQNEAFVRGHIEAKSGSIGGWKIENLSMKSANGSIELDALNEQIILGNLSLTKFRKSDNGWDGIISSSDSGDSFKLLRRFDNGWSGGLLRLVGTGTSGGSFIVTTGGESTTSRLEMAPAVPGSNNPCIVMDASSKYNGTASITVQDYNTTSTQKSVIKPSGITTPAVEAQSSIISPYYRLDTSKVKNYAPSSDGQTITIFEQCQMIRITNGTSCTLKIFFTPSGGNGSVLIVKRTVPSGHTFIRNASGTEIDHFTDAGMTILVYNGSWQ